MDKKNSRQPLKRSRPTYVDGIIQPRLGHRPETAPPDRTSPSTAAPEQLDNQPASHPELSVPQPKSLLNTTIPGASSSSRPPQPLAGAPKTKSRFWQFWRRAKKWSLKRKIVTAICILLIAAVGFAGWDVWQLDHKLNHLAVGNLTTSVGGAENILVAGSTNRCNLKVQNAQWGFCSQGVTGVNSDIIFIVHVVPSTHTVSLLSIPRDTFVPNARSGDQAFKIDAALYEGPTQLVNAIQQDFAIPIQHYAEVGFDGFVNIVNAVGGIKMNFPMPVYDSESYLDIKTPGCQLLNGVEALQVVRARHLQYDPPDIKTSDVYLWPQEAVSDIARIARTHEFLRVLASTVDAKGLGNPITDQKLVDAIAPQVQVDSGLSTSSMLQLMEDLHAVSINNVPQYTLPISTPDFGDYIYNGVDYGDVVFPTEASDQHVINEFLGVKNTDDTMTGKSLPTPSSVSVNVIDGSGTSGEAIQVMSSLSDLGFNVLGEPGAASPLSYKANETVVNYASPSTEADAEAVARQMTGSVILSENSNLVTAGSDVTILTGNGLTVNTPPTASSSSTASSPTPSSTTVTTMATTGLSPASSATQALSAWDPRACTEQ